jgi:hypothetical protein
VLAPDPGRDPWYVDFVLAPSGDVVATACAIEAPRVDDVRCGLYEAAAGENRLTRRRMPTRALRPCSLLAAGERWLIGSNLEHCRADGGPPAFVPYMWLDRSTMKTGSIMAPSGLQSFGTANEEDGPELIANIRPGPPYPSVYPPASVILRVNDPQFTLDQLAPEVGDPARYHRYIWSIGGRGPGWTLFHGYSPDDLACAIKSEPDEPSACTSGPAVLETDSGTFELPAGTWGEVVPPLGFAGL